MPKSIRRDLSTRIGLVIVCVNIAIGICYYTYSIRLHHRDFKASITYQTEHIADTFTLQLWLYDLNTTQELCKIILESPEIKGLTLLDHNKKIIFQRDATTNHTIPISRVLYHESGKQVGYLKIYYTDISWEKQRKDILFIGIFMIIGTLAGSLLFINILLKRHLSKPLNDLQENMALLAQGDFKQSHLVNQKAEIQNIIDTFNLLVISLHDRDKALYNANKIINRSPAVAFIWRNEEGWPIDFTSHNVIALTGYSHTDFTDGKVMFKELVHPDDIAMVTRDVNKASTKEGLQKYNPTPYRIICKDGAIKWVTGSSEILRDSHGATTHFEGILYDISEEVKLEKRLQQAQKMEAIGTLAGGIAHDFNNILGVIIGYTDLAREDAPADSAYSNDLDKVLSAGHRAKELVAQILDFSRKSEIKRIPIQIQSLIKEALKMLRPTIPSTIKIEGHIESECGVVLVDPTQVNQILFNLCTNATQAMEAIGGVLKISLKNTAVSTNPPPSTSLKAGQYVELIVEDTGPGISSLHIGKIFDPYFTTKEMGKGTGMGLAIIHGIIGSYDGAITVESEPGQGAVFHVYFPVVAQQEHPQLQQTESQPCPGRGNILFVDDEPLLAEMGKEMLERIGYQVTMHQSSLEALTTFQNNPQHFDAIITDQTMPGMTGSDLARRVLQIRPDIPIILCTGYSNIMDEKLAKTLGIKEFAMKPLTQTVIASLLHKVLQDSPAKPS
jgi:PAS domain S-box-containing protein